MCSPVVCVPLRSSDKNNSFDIVTSLLKKPFFERAEVEQRNIIIRKHPTPKLPLQQQYKNGRRTFCISWYNQNKWLCGSLTKMTLFCWPCLLLSRKPNVWTSGIYINLKNIAVCLKAHSRSGEHLKCILSYEELRRKRIEELIQIIRNFVTLAFKLGSVMTERLDHLMIPVHYELLDEMVNVCKEEIINQINKSSYLTVGVEPTVDQQQLVIIFRYVFKGQIFERFWGLIRPEKFTAKSIVHALLRELNKLEKIGDKLIGLNYLGASGIGREIQHNIKTECPYAYLFHSYAYPRDLELGVASREEQEFFKSETAAALLCSDKYNIYQNKFPKNKFTKTVEAYPFFDVAKLKNELIIIYKKNNMSFLSDGGCVLPLLRFIRNNHLKEGLSETYKLLKIICTIPMTTSRSKRCLNTLNKVKLFFEKGIDKLRVDALVMLAMEIDFIQQIPDFNEKVMNMVTSKELFNDGQLPSTSNAQPALSDDAMLIDNIKEEYDDTFEENAEEVLTVTKEELVDILNESQPSSSAGVNTVSLKEEPISIDLEFSSVSEPPNKKSKLDTLPVNGDKPGTSNQFSEDPTHAFYDQINTHLATKIQDDPSLTGMVDSSGNVDLFFESMLALAKTLSPLDQVLLQRNIANVVFGMKVTQLTKKKMASSETVSPN